MSPLNNGHTHTETHTQHANLSPFPAPYSHSAPQIPPPPSLQLCAWMSSRGAIRTAVAPRYRAAFDCSE